MRGERRQRRLWRQLAAAVGRQPDDLDVGARRRDFGVFADHGETAGGGEQVPYTVDLQRALARLPKQVEAAGEADEDEPAVSLHTRAVPLIQLLEAAVAGETYVRWE